MNKAGKKPAPAVSQKKNHLFSNHLKATWPWWRLTITGLAFTALVLTAILSWHSLLGGQMAGCGGESPCGQVLNSRWSMLAGVLPVSGLAMGAYMAVLVASFFIGYDTEITIRRLALKCIMLLAGSVTGSAIWFIVLQKWIIGEFCSYCMVTHTIGLLIASLIIWRVYTSDNQQEDVRGKDGWNSGSSSHFMSRQILTSWAATGLLTAGLVLAGTLAAFQMSYTPSPISNDTALQDNIPLIEYSNSPIVGVPDAPYIVTLLFDYQCSHCQKIHLMLNETVRRYSGKLAFILCPTPLHSSCNVYIPQGVDIYKNSCELARIGLAVWFADQKVFHDFENWMFSFESGNSWVPRSPEAAKAKAIELTGQLKFNEAMANPAVEKYLQTCTQIYGQTIRSGNTGVPKMLYGSGWIIPEPYSTDELIMILQNSLGVPEP